MFEVYVEWVSAPPSLRPGQVVMGNLPAHQRGEVRELIEARGAELAFLPSYSPAEARTREALIEALGAAIPAVTSQDVRGFFEHCGRRRVSQLL